MLSSNLDVSEMFVERQAQRSSMHARHLNEQLVRVLKTIGYDVGFQKGQGQYLYDRDGVRYLDLLSGFGVFAIGRNHPALRHALKSVLDADLPNLVQLDVSTLAGVLAERLLEHVPYLDKVFFANSGAETVEAAIKFARGATGRPGMNRVAWDLRYDAPRLIAMRTTPPENPHIWEEPRFRGQDTRPVTHWGLDTAQVGPIVVPGKYTVKLTVDGQSLTQPIEM